MRARKLQVGDRVYIRSPDGKVSNVTGVISSQNRHWYHVKFPDGVEDKYTRDELRKIKVGIRVWEI